MIWKSNLNDFEMELIDDFGGKTSQVQKQPAASRPATTSAAPKTQAPRPTTAKKGQTSAVKVPQTLTAQSSMQKVPTSGTFCGMQETYPAETVPEDGVTGNGEELAQTLEKVVSQLEIISRTLHVLEQRVSMNEESVSGVMDYFREVKEQRESSKNEIL
jgi:hypothetical protein